MINMKDLHKNSSVIPFTPFSKNKNLETVRLIR